MVAENVFFPERNGGQSYFHTQAIMFVNGSSVLIYAARLMHGPA